MISDTKIVRKSIAPGKPKNLASVSVCLVGDSKVGKTALANRLAKDCYQENTEPTVVVGFEQYFDPDDKRLVTVVSAHQLNIYDFMGNKSFDELRSEFLPQMNAVLYCYDLSNPASFESLEMWRKETEPQVKKEALTVLCGLKADLAKAVPDKKVAAFVKTKLTKVHEVSSKTSSGINKLLKDLLDLV